MRRVLLLLVPVVLAAGVFAWTRLPEGADPEAGNVPEALPVAPTPGAAPPAAGAAPAPLPAEPIHPDRRRFAQPDGPGAPGAMPETIEYPLMEKLARESLSVVPHRIVGAWDDAPGSPELGARRAFILVVSPGLSDAELADLARDVRDRHGDAEWLTLRVFDSAAAATRPSWTDGGAARDEHLVAELRRNTAGRGEWLKVRGRDVEL